MCRCPVSLHLSITVPIPAAEPPSGAATLDPAHRKRYFSGFRILEFQNSKTPEPENSEIPKFQNSEISIFEVGSRRGRDGKCHRETPFDIGHYTPGNPCMQGKVNCRRQPCIRVYRSCSERGQKAHRGAGWQQFFIKEKGKK